MDVDSSDSDPSPTCFCGALPLPESKRAIALTLIHWVCSAKDRHKYHRLWVNAGGDMNRPKPPRWETAKCDCT